ncbi:MAG TPA: regulatory protein RecX [Candidatus Eisenbacteria bacterium]|nr:regulatory protein RecX [Candidatus Eisenbacteria bacterium]
MSRARRDPAEPPLADPAAAREAALRLLERTRRTRADLARRLRDKGYAPATVTAVLDRLAEVGLVDDVEFARAYLAGRWGRRPAGWRRLQQELRVKGVAEADVAAARARIEAREGAVDELGTARKLAEQARPRYARLEPRAREQRLYALLARRGFDADVIRRALAIPDDAAEE